MKNKKSYLKKKENTYLLQLSKNNSPPKEKKNFS